MAKSLRFWMKGKVVTCCRQGCLYLLLMGFHCHWVLSCRIYRRKLRAKFGLPAEPCGDCCVHFCCESCAHAELKNRGLDPSIGFTLTQLSP
ncbi:hypothetical protein ACB094_02G089100 [Castanea mollissima]